VKAWRNGAIFPMTFLVLNAYWKLVQFDLHLARGSFATFYDEVRHCPIERKAAPAEVMERICTAVNLACIWYWKEVRCLQRSAATTCLLRRHGVPAQMVIGVQQIPFKAHAWVEVSGRVVNDKPYMPEIYGVLDRC
jgi:Transglutaminase-like superfamily